MTMKWENTGMKNPIARAKGLGSARDGVESWLTLRATGLALVPLTVWLVCSIISLMGADYAEFTTWLAEPVNAVLMILLIIATLIHSQIGTKEVTEDYIHNEGLKAIKLIAQKLIYFALGVACIFAVLKIAL